MKTVDDIIFNELYSHASTFLLLLYDYQPYLSIPVELPHADSLTYIRPFRNLLTCQQHVDDHRQKMITLFTTDRKFLHWHGDSHGLNPNLSEIYIYCDTLEGHLAMLRSKESYSKKIQKVIKIQNLDFYLLSTGLEYNRLVSEEFKDDHGLRDQFYADGKRILEAMKDYFGNGVTRLSEEVSK